MKKLLDNITDALKKAIKLGLIAAPFYFLAGACGLT